ncbi:MAG: GtrA family protein [Puniceicoccales bacterium]|jgi:putative flippase GtrA|nr:GtrA family protein [Puniceicoccales bacterium]
MKKKAYEILGDLREFSRTRSWAGFQQTRAYFACRQIFFYGIIGCGCAALDFFLYLLLSRGVDWTPKILFLVDSFQNLAHMDPESLKIFHNAHWNVYFPNFLSVNAGILCSFLLNAYFNFKRSDNLHIRALKFFAVGYCGLFLSMAILRFGVVVLHAPDWMVKIFSALFVAALQFFLNKFLAFGMAGKQPARPTDASASPADSE